MFQRTRRIDDLRLTPAQVAALLEVSEERLTLWIDGDLLPQDDDVIEVGLSLLESVHRMPWRDDDFHTQMLASVEALPAGSAA